MGAAKCSKNPPGRKSQCCTIFFSMFLSPWAFQVILQNKILGSARCLHCVCARSCPTLCNPMDCSPPGSSVHGISQAGILEWVAISFSRGSSQLRDRTHVSCISCTGTLQLVFVYCGPEKSICYSSPCCLGTSSMNKFILQQTGCK